MDNRVFIFASIFAVGIFLGLMTAYFFTEPSVRIEYSEEAFAVVKGKSLNDRDGLFGDIWNGKFKYEADIRIIIEDNVEEDYLIFYSDTSYDIGDLVPIKIFGSN